MAKSNHINNSFVSGEVSPEFLGRTDLRQYNQSCSKIENFLGSVTGSVSKRPGSVLQQQVLVKDGSSGTVSTPGAARIFPFYGSDGIRKIFILTDDDPIKSNSGDVLWQVHDAFSSANLDDTDASYLSETDIVFTDTTLATTSTQTLFSGYYTFTQKELDELQYAQLGDTVYFTHPNYHPFRIKLDPSRGSATQDIFVIEPVGFQATSGFSNSADDSWRNIPFRTVVSSADASEFDGIKLEISSGDWSLTDNGTTPGSGTLYNYRSILDFGKGDFIKLTRLTETVVVVVTGVTTSGFPTEYRLDVEVVDGDDSTFADGDIFGLDSSPDNTYELPYWSRGNNEATVFGPSRSYKFPRAVDFFENRIIFGGTREDRGRLWFSRINNFEWLDSAGLAGESGPSTASDNSFTVNLPEGNVSNIQWIYTDKNLFIGTDIGEYVVRGPDNTASIALTNVSLEKEGSFGSSYKQAYGLDNTLAFLNKDGTKVREFTFDFEQNAFNSEDLNIISGHLSRQSITDLEDAGVSESNIEYVGGFKQITITDTPQSIIWALDNNGRLHSGIRDRLQEVISWQRQILSGDDSSDSKPFVLNIAPMRGFSQDTDTDFPPGSSSDKLFMLVKRSVGEDDSGGTIYNDKLFIEHFATRWEEKTMDKGWQIDDLRTLDYVPNFMDMSVHLDNTSNDDGIHTVQHGKGAVLGVINSGVFEGIVTVDDSDEIDLTGFLDDPTASYDFVVGFIYDATIQPVTPEVRSELESSQGQPRRIDQVHIHFYRSYGAKYGRAADENQENTPIYDPEEIDFKDDGTAVRLFTGYKKVVFPPGYSRRPEVLVKSTKPFPCVITHMVYRMAVYEG